MSKPYIIRVSSYKGGVGKTTISINLASALQALGDNVLVVDKDSLNPCVALYLGLENKSKLGYKEAVCDNTSIKKLVIKDKNSGIDILPGSLEAMPFVPDNKQLDKFMDRLSHLTEYDFVLLDTPPGMEFIGETRYYNEGLIISTQDMLSFSSAIRMMQTYKIAKLANNVVINKFEVNDFSSNIDDMMEVLGRKTLAVLPNTVLVPRSLAMHTSAFNLNKKSEFSSNIAKLANYYHGII